MCSARRDRPRWRWTSGCTICSAGCLTPMSICTARQNAWAARSGTSTSSGRATVHPTTRSTSRTCASGPSELHTGGRTRSGPMDGMAMASDERAEPRVGLIMGSDSDWPVMEAAAHALAEFAVPFEVGVVSAHRTPDRMLDYARTAASRGIEVIIAGAGGAAHLPGMVASATALPVIGVPVPLARLDGLDSLLSIVQMPAGVPVATVSIGGGRNAGLLAVRILGASDPALRDRLDAFRASLEESVLEKDAALRDRLLGRRGKFTGE